MQKGTLLMMHKPVSDAQEAQRHRQRYAEHGALYMFIDEVSPQLWNVKSLKTGKVLRVQSFRLMLADEHDIPDRFITKRV